MVVRSIATGHGHTEYTPIGHTNNLASRLQALAPTGFGQVTSRALTCADFAAAAVLGVRNLNS